MLFLVLGTAISFAAETANVESVRLEANMDLFVEDWDSSRAAAAELRVESMPEKVVERYRKNAGMAFAEKRYDSLKVIMENGNLYADSIYWGRIFTIGECYVVDFLMKNFASLVNKEVLPNYLGVGDDFSRMLQRRLTDMVASGELEQVLNEVEDECDRAFIRIVLEQLATGDKEKTSELIEKYRSKLKENQLHVLVEKYWEKSGYDMENYSAFSMGPAFVMMLGDVSKKVENGFGYALGIDWVRKGFFYEWFMNFQFSGVSEPDTLSMIDCGWDFNFGHWLVNQKYVSLYAFATIGFGMDMLADDGENEERANNDKLPYQFYPTFGAGFIVDLFFTEMKETSGNHHGIRFRAGVKNIWADDLVQKNGFRLYASVEWQFHEVSRKNYGFDYQNK